MAVIDVRCRTCDKEFRCCILPRIAGFPKGNLLLSAGILFAGARPRKEEGMEEVIRATQLNLDIQENNILAIKTVQVNPTASFSFSVAE